MIRRTKDLMRPPFIANHKSIMRDTGRQIAYELLTDKYRYGAKPVVANGVSAIGALFVTVLGLTVAIQRGDVLNFGGKFARASAGAAIGATSIPTDALVAAINNGDIAYGGTVRNTNGQGNGYVPAGVEVDLLADGRVLPCDIGTAGVTAYGITETSQEEDSDTDAMSGGGIITQGMVYENLLYNATGAPKVIDATVKSELLARGGAWLFLVYADNT